ncbi:ABA4-like family protein [Paucibacter sp. JuS9]|uniref:ABA4-like family protein n=1 Tax=Paucibacter sp. JuS9 TaxID=3228748 RepID=UPI003757459F
MPPLPITPDALFSAGSALAMSGWLALALSPAGRSWAPAVRRYAGRVVPLLLAVAYVALFASNGMGDGGYDSVAAVQRLLAQPALLVAGWLHYLAFDLFVGSWIAEHAGALGLPHWLVLPLLALTFLFGPAGLLAFALLRKFWRQRPAQAMAL